MDLQTAFYITGIIFMAGWIILLAIASYALWMIQREVRKAPEHVKNILSNVFQNNKSSVFGVAGTFVLPFILNMLKRKFFRR